MQQQQNQLQQEFCGPAKQSQRELKKANTPSQATGTPKSCTQRVRCRELLRGSIFVGIGLFIFWLEQALNLTVTLVLIGMVVALIWLSVFVAISTSFLWLPVCLICLPLLTTVAILLRMTRLRDICRSFVTRLQEEPWKSKIWTQGILELTQRLIALYYRLFTEQRPGSNCGYALLSLDGVIKSEGGIFSKLGQRIDIFQLQMYYYTALQATRTDTLEGMRVLDVSHGQAEQLKFLAKHFQPHAVVGFDSVKRQFTTGLTSTLTPGTQINLTQQLRSEKRFDLILCIETWSLLQDHERFLAQMRELLSQADDEQDQAPYIDDDQNVCSQRFVIADIFRKDEEPRMKALLSKYFEIEDVLDISINVQKSIIKQRERRQKYLAGATHSEIAGETLRQLQDQLSLKQYPSLSFLTRKTKQSTSAQQDASLIQHATDKYQLLQGRVHGGHQYLIYVLKHKSLLEESQILGAQPDIDTRHHN